VGELIAVLSGKGGTGKTSICAGLAVALAEQGKRVLCIDCDVGLRNLDISLGMADVEALSFQDVLCGGYALEQAVHHPNIGDLYFLTAPVNCAPEQVDRVAFCRMLQRAGELFDYVVLDAPAGIDAGFHLAARFADRIVLVAGPDPAAVRDAGHAGDILRQMGKYDVKLVVNRIYPKMASGMSVTVDDIMDQTGLPLLGVVPEDSNVTMAAAYGRPLLYYTHKGASAACRRIAKRLMGWHVPIKLK